MPSSAIRIGGPSIRRQLWLYLGLLIFASQAMAILPSPLIGAVNQEWGETSSGLRCRILPVAANSDEQKPAEAKAHGDADYETAEQVTLLVELENVSEEVISLCSVRYGENWTPPAPGRSHSNWYSPLFFDVEITDSTGKPVETARPEFGRGDQMMLISGVAIDQLQPGAKMQLLLRPGAWSHGLVHRLASGELNIKVRYHGFSPGLKQDIPEAWKDKDFTKTWSRRSCFERRANPSQKGESD